LVWLVLLGVLISSLCSMEGKSAAWYCLLTILLLGFLVLNLLSFYIFFELSLVPILIIILYWGGQPERLSAGIYFIMYTTFFSIPYMVFIVLLLPKQELLLVFRLNLRGFLCFILLMPFLVKIPVLGFHFWLPKAHVEARTRGSMVLAGLLLKLGRYGVYRVSSFVNPGSFHIFSLSSWLIIARASRIITFFQSDIKKLVAYSRVTHITFLIVALSSFNKTSLFGALIVSLAHGWASIGIFASAGIFSHIRKSRLGQMVRGEIKFSWVVLLFGGLLISNASIPPLPSFFPEVFIVLSLSKATITVLCFIIIRFGVCYYNTYLFFWVNHTKHLEAVRRIYKISESCVLFSLVSFTLISLIWLVLF